jgi:hypothetical protein
VPVIRIHVHRGIASRCIHSILVTRLIRPLILINLLSVHDYRAHEGGRNTERRQKRETSEPIFHHMEFS